MGMFDSVMVRCPECSEPMEFQSKAGPCQLANYTLHTAPPAVIADVAEQPQRCVCGHNVTLHVQTVATIS
jgi:hypothetical protein